jgi:hypothetical protein
MKTITFCATCPGCGHTTVPVMAKKPTVLTPSVTHAVCPHCDSRSLYRVAILQQRQSAKELSVTSINIRPTLKLLEMIQARQAVAPATPETL